MDITVADQLQDAVALRLVTFHDKKVPYTAFEKSVDGGKRVGQCILGDGLVQAGESPEFQSALQLVLDRDDVYGNMSGVGVMLQAIKNRPPLHVWQLDVQHDGIRLEFPCQR